MPKNKGKFQHPNLYFLSMHKLPTFVLYSLITIFLSPLGKGGKNRRRGKNENETEKRELVFKEDGQGIYYPINL